VKLEIKAELLKELALESATPSPDIGLRAGADQFHPTYRGRAIVSFASWDLLDLHRRREVAASVVQAVEQFGGASSAARFSGGLTPAHLEAEKRIAQFFGAETGLIFSSRNQSVLTCVTTLCSEGWIVLGNALSPLPLADASALVGAEFYEFDTEETLRALLERHQLAKRVLVVVESVSSVTGEQILKPPVWAALEQLGAWVLVDESAALGVLGLRGAGSADGHPKSSSLIGRIVGFGPISGLEVTGLGISNEFRELILKRSRYLRADPAPHASVVSGAEKLLNLVEVAIAQRERASSRGRMVETALRAQGWSVLGGGGVPIVSVWFESLLKARAVQDALLQRGVFVDAIPARSMRKNGAVLRVLVSVAHAPQEVERLIEGLAEISRRGAAEK
jgi:8-amino-7-oxononanoate synthase